MFNNQEVEGQFLIENPRQLGCLVPEICKIAGDLTMWLFEGDLGAGKTTLIQAICKAKEVVDQVTSPTYSLLHEYRNSQSDIFYHFDFYRINSDNEALDIGCDEYFDSGNICFVEWPEKVASILPDKNLTIKIKVQDRDNRLIKVIKND